MRSTTYKTMKQLLIPGFIIFSMLSGISLVQAGMPHFMPKPELLNLRVAITAHLLYQELEIDEEQKAVLIEKLSEMRERKQAFDNEIEAMDDLEKQELETLLARIKANGKFSDDDRNKLREIGRSRMKSASPIFKNMKDDFSSVLAIFNEEQLERLKKFKPPFVPRHVPSKNFGCAGNAEELIEQIRYAPPHFMERLTKRIEKRGKKRNSANLDSMAARIKTIREMDESEFLSKKSDLAAQIDPTILDRLKKRCDRKKNRWDRFKDKDKKHGRYGEKARRYGDDRQNRERNDNDFGLGPEFKMGGHGRGAHHGMIRHVLLSDSFFEALTE